MSIIKRVNWAGINFPVFLIGGIMTIKELRRKQSKEKAVLEDTLFIIGMFVLLVIWGQYCLSHGLVIWLD